MTDVTEARLVGGTMSALGLVGGGVAWVNDLTLFLPFAAVLLLFGIGFQMAAWSMSRR